MTNEINNMAIINFFIESCCSLIATKALPNELYQLDNINLPYIIQHPIGHQIKQIQLILGEKAFII